LQVLELLKKLKEEQENSHKKGYLKGIFASQRFQKPMIRKREDENVFFSAAIVYILQTHLHQFSNKEKKIAEHIITNTLSSYPKFKNFRGLNTYNFFKTQPMDFFPNGKILRHFKKFKLADDADDTAYIYLTNPNQNHQWLKNKLIAHANGSKKWSKTIPKKHTHLKTYAVYFGENMNIEVDLCVLTNILLWHFTNFNTETQQDNDSITFIVKSIQSKDYLDAPYLVSPCYPSIAQICYHVSRLIKFATNHHALQALKPDLIYDIKQQLLSPQSQLHKTLLNIALLNLDISPKQTLKYHFESFIENTNFFYTSIPLMIPIPWVRKLMHYRIFNLIGLKTKCNAYAIAFLLEHELLKLSSSKY